MSASAKALYFKGQFIASFPTTDEVKAWVTANRSDIDPWEAQIKTIWFSDSQPRLDTGEMYGR